MVPYIKVIINKDVGCPPFSFPAQPYSAEKRSFRSACVSRSSKPFGEDVNICSGASFHYKWQTNIQTTSTSRALSFSCQWVSLVHSPLTLAACWASISARFFLLRTAGTTVAELWTETSTPCASCRESSIRRTNGHIRINKWAPFHPPPQMKANIFACIFFCNAISKHLRPLLISHLLGNFGPFFF